MRLDDPHYLRTDQYRDGGHLSARVALHQRFSTNHYGWACWVFDRLVLDLADGARIFEIGCGTGELWVENRERLPPGWRVTLSDFSAGMLHGTRRRLHDAGLPLPCCVADVGAIPFAAETFDAVIANHMLYHVPDRSRALAEIRRVLRPGGVFFAATNGRNHLRELDELTWQFAPESRGDDIGERFNLENGAAQLRPWFSEIHRADYADALAITEVEPVIAYVLSTPARDFLDGERLAELRREIADRIARDGALRVTKASGLFRCCAQSHAS